jgi:hypothetical protein
MAVSHPLAADFYHPEFAAFLAGIGHPFQMHRKLWEYGYIAHKLASAGMVKTGNRGLCFGVGQERLPALFAQAGCIITATDAPPRYRRGLDGIDGIQRRRPRLEFSRHHL